MKPSYIFVIAVILASVCVDAQITVKKRGKVKVKKTNVPINLPGCGCQNPLFNIVDCGCRAPVIDASYALAPCDVPVCGCQVPFIDIPNYRYVNSVDINSMGYLNPLDLSNFGCLASPIALPSIEYIVPLELPCGCQGPQCGCSAPAIQLPTYPFQALAPTEVPKCGCQELRSPAFTFGPVSSVIEIPNYSSVIQVPACGCSGSCGCQNSLACGCPGPICGCQAPMPCGCPGPVCGCQAPMPCGCRGSVCECPAPVPCGCRGPVCGCQNSLSCGCPGPICECQTIGVPSCGCGISGCQCGTKYLRQIALQPPFL